MHIGGSVPTNTTTGYLQENTMDGTVKHIDSDNDRDPILVNGKYTDCYP